MKITIDVYADVLCPYCYIGKRNLKNAIAQFSQSWPNVAIEVTYRPFYLIPKMRPHGYRKGTIYSLGSNQEATMLRIVTAARAAGINLDFSGTTGNSRSAQILVAAALRAAAHPSGPQSPASGASPISTPWRSPHAIQDAIVTALFRGHFQDGEDITDIEFLARVAAESGLVAAMPDYIEDVASPSCSSDCDGDVDMQARADAQAVSFVQQLLADDELGQSVDRAAYWARTEGDISAIPSFTLQNRYQVGGYQEPEMFLKLFERIVAGEGEPIVDRILGLDRHVTRDNSLNIH